MAAPVLLCSFGIFGEDRRLGNTGQFDALILGSHCRHAEVGDLPSSKA
jgi:hypothetical protein